jgi:hypothetical protein
MVGGAEDAGGDHDRHRKRDRPGIGPYEDDHRSDHGGHGNAEERRARCTRRTREDEEGGTGSEDHRFREAERHTQAEGDGDGDRQERGVGDDRLVTADLEKGIRDRMVGPDSVDEEVEGDTDESRCKML